MLVIDGHNLIGKISGLSLSALDDEDSLLALLQNYARAKRKKIEVFFDGAPVGHSGKRGSGLVTAHFVRSGKTADEAIRQFLNSLGQAARNTSVVTSDRMVQAEARQHHAQVITSEDFARQLAELPPPGAPAAAKKPGKPPATTEPATGNLQEWYDVFGFDAAEAEKPIEPEHKHRPKKPSEKHRPQHGFKK